jgi:hypothetical protein
MPGFCGIISHIATPSTNGREPVHRALAATAFDMPECEAVGQWVTAVMN